MGKMIYFTQLNLCKNIFFFEVSHKYDVCECKIPRYFRPKTAEHHNAGYCLWSIQTFLEHSVVRIV